MYDIEKQELKDIYDLRLKGADEGWYHQRHLEPRIHFRLGNEPIIYPFFNIWEGGLKFVTVDDMVGGINRSVNDLEIDTIFRSWRTLAEFDHWTDDGGKTWHKPVFYIQESVTI
jgi:hypothetical protein